MLTPLRMSPMRPRPVALWALLTLLLAAGPAAAQTSFPMVTHVTPVAVQRGKSTLVGVYGQQKFAGAYKVLVEGAGVTAEVTSVDKDNVGKVPRQYYTIDVKVTVAPDAALGVREFRVA